MFVEADCACSITWSEISEHDFLISSQFAFFKSQNYLVRKILSRVTIRVSNNLDPDQARHFVGPDLGPNSLQRLLADDISRHRVKVGVVVGKVNCSCTEAREKKSQCVLHVTPTV